MQQQPYRLALRVSLSYGLVGAVWIFSSDWLVAVLVPSAERITHFQTYKGWAFIGVTTALLYAVLRLVLGRWEREAQERRRAEALTDTQNQVLEMIARGVPLPESLTALLHFLEAQSPDLRYSILLLDADGVHIRHGAAPNLPEEFNRMVDGLVIGEGAGSCGTAAFRREPVIVADTATDPLWNNYRAVAAAHGLRACWSTPIFAADRRVLGTFAIYSRQPGRPNAQHLRFIGIATHVAALAIGKQREEAALREGELKQRQLAERLTVAQAVGKVGSWETDLITMTVIWSEQTHRIFETDPATFQPTHPAFLGLVHPEDRDAVAQAFHDSLCGTDPAAVEHRILLPGGQTKIVEERWQVFRNDQGIPVRAVGTTQDITERKQAEMKLDRSQGQLRALIARLQRAQEEERTRVAREIHDELGQLLTSLKMDVRWLEKKLSAPDLPPALNPLLDRAVAASELADTTIATVQKITAELRPGALDKLGLAAALGQRARQFQERSGIHCTVTALTPDVALPPEVATELFYIAQEALTNVARHAHAQNVEIRLATESDVTVLEVRDDGVGITEADQSAVRSLGLLGMKERVGHCQGTIAFQRGVTGGTKITVRIPRQGTTPQKASTPS